MKRVICIGEPLVELSRAPAADADLFERRVGGDTLNVAAHLARMTAGQVEVSYLTRLGEDAQSDWLIEAMRADGVGTDLIERVPAAAPGLYMISVSETGERSFSYWRGQSPARGMFGSGATQASSIPEVDLIYLSGITLAVIAPEAREALVEEMARRREAGAAVVFDPNYRAALWADPHIAAEVTAAAAVASGLVMPTLDDMRDLFGVADAEAALETLQSMTSAEIVLKTGGGPILHFDGDLTSRECDLSGPRVDTTGAGDSFNAGFLAARLLGREPSFCIDFGHRLASRVVAHRGAIPARSATKDLAAELSREGVGG